MYRVLRQPGQLLPASSRARFEPPLGRGLGSVRVHRDAPADRAARSVGALAFTVGNHIVFRDDAPVDGPRGDRLLAHELAHVAAGHPGLRRQTPEPTIDPVLDRARDLDPLYQQLGTEGKLGAQAAGFLFGFGFGLAKGLAGKLDRARIEAISAELRDPANQPYLLGGYAFGIGKGALEDIGSNLSLLWKMAKWLFWHLGAGATLSAAADAWAWLFHFDEKLAETRDEAAGTAAFVASATEALEQLATAISTDPAFGIAIGAELGEPAGELAADWYQGTFGDATPFEKGKYIGIPVGYLVVEVALLFLGPEEWVAAGSALLAKVGLDAAELGGLAARLFARVPALADLAKVFGRGLEEAKAGEAIVETSKAGRAIEEGSRAAEEAAQVGEKIGEPLPSSALRETVSASEAAEELDLLVRHPELIKGTPPNRTATIGEHTWMESAEGWCRYSLRFCPTTIPDALKADHAASLEARAGLREQIEEFRAEQKITREVTEEGVTGGTVAAAQAEVEGLEQRAFTQGSTNAKQPGVPNNPRYQSPSAHGSTKNHAEQSLFGDIADAIDESRSFEAGLRGKPKPEVGGRILVEVEQPMCTTCAQALAGSGKPPGVVKQFSDEYPGILIVVTNMKDDTVLFIRGGAYVAR